MVAYSCPAISITLVELNRGKITSLTVLSEKGNDLKLIVPWGSQGTINTKSGKIVIRTPIVSLKTTPGELISFSPF
ncbi:MAG: hypothetical protein EOO88_43150 [Pedobacter sp.]|nr:MAG: hypothetical protein EOO88_43150 [Pedobacter sp.]